MHELPFTLFSFVACRFLSFTAASEAFRMYESSLNISCYLTCSLSDAYYGSGALRLLGKEGDMKGALLCPLAESELGKATLDLPSAYFASHMLSRAR